jgi:chemotaxis protein methyltransferase CheR
MISNTSDLITNGEFAQFQRLIYQIAGISLGDSKKVLVVGRLGRRLKHHGLESFTQYYRLVTGGEQADELQTMVNLLTTNETYFFREEAHFDFLRQQVLAQHPAGQPFEVWSAASSTGEEIYTLAMVLAETLGVEAAWSILGSDISSKALAVAERGHYWLDHTRGLPERHLRKYCLKGVRAQEGSFLIAPEIRGHARFQQINLNESLPNIGPFDLVFLRNVMIYFDQPTKQQVVARVVQKLRPGGYLIVGHSESLNGISDAVTSVKPTIYRRPG